jgi:ligand-binding sensor domain-containing protein/signal transduction histidine kinase
MRIKTIMLPPKLFCLTKVKLTLTVISLLLCLSCNKDSKPGGITISGPKSVVAQGYVVPKDSITAPEIIVAGIPEIIPVKKTVVSRVLNNKHKAGTPKIVRVANPKKIIPGQDSVLLPKSVPAISKPFVPGMPEVVQAKDAFNKEQNPESFSSFGKLQGLKHLVVTAVIQDRNGNMWFGTGGGAVRYDGKTFTLYTKNEGLCDNRIPYIKEDKKGNLWFCTYAGVTKYDGKYFTNYTSKEGMINGAVLSMAEDKDGNFWFSTQGGGVCKFEVRQSSSGGLSGTEGSFTHYTNKQGLSDNTVSAMTIDKNGNLWIGTAGGVNKFDGKTFTHYTTNEGLSDNMVNAIMLSENGDLWVGTESGGANKFDGKTFTQYTEKEGLASNSVNYMLEDKRGDLWFCTFGGGMSKFDGKTFTNYSEKEGLSNNMVMSATEDRSGNLWFGTSSGVNLYHGRVFTHLTKKEGLKNNIIRLILEDKRGTLWLGTPAGELFTYDIPLNDSVARGELFTYMDGIEERTSLIQDGVCDKKGNVWFASFEGLLKYDGDHFFRYSMDQGLQNEGLTSVLEDSKGNLWIGNQVEGVDKFDGKTFTQYTSKQGLCKGLIKVIKEDRHGNKWFAGEGACKFDGKDFIRFTQKEGFTNSIVSDVLEDKQGNIWFATNGDGIFKYDGKSFTNYTEKEGLSNNNVSSILQDKSGNLWFGSRFGLNKLKTGRLGNVSDPGKPSSLFKYYTYEDGFFGVGCNPNAIYEARDSTIWVGTSDRLTVYHPQGDILDTMPPNVQLSNLGLYYENIPWNRLSRQDTSFVLGNGVVLKDFKFDSISKWYGLPENLKLAHNNNYLTFNFIGITQKQPDKVRYQYKLEGLDENWSALTNRTDVSYGNLDPGVYTFKIRAVSGEGYWSNDFNYTFTISPPFWQTWWFKGLIIIVGSGLIVGFFQYRTRTLRRRKKILEKTVKERTKELAQRTIELEDSNQGLEQVNREKDRIMQILVHDLRNPLSGIYRLSSMMLESSDNPAKHREMTGLIHDSSMSLFEMIDDLIEATIKNHKETVKPKETDMQLLVTQSISALEFKANEKKQEIVVDAKVQLFAFVDPQKIQRVLSNLISNAIKFSPGGSTIIMSLIKQDNSLQISIEDRGIGIPEELKDRVFDMFTKAKRHGTAGEEPFGLGLSICKQIVDAHNGKIWFESEGGKGTRFYLEFPLLQD